VALVAERNTSVRMLIGEDMITLEAATGDQAQASEAIEATVEQPSAGDPPVVAAGFNPSYLLDALNVLDTPYANFAFTAPSKPCQLVGLDELDGEPHTDYRHVIMLMRLPS
jgi:DNA polymerase-3 subunit beta